MGFGRLIVGFVGVMGLVGAMICSCEGRKFYVGGKEGWGLNPSESFNHWAERNRFQVNDTLYFKYKEEKDSVLVVSKEDYFSCNTKNPVISLKDNGESIFKFGHSGPFYFISGNADSCQKGQKLIVVVLALTHNKHHHSQPPHSSSSPVATPSQSQSPPAESPEKSGVVSTAPTPAKNSAFGGGVAVSLLGVGTINVVLLSSFLVGLF
ncbi:early nodulin-like protein 1 [Benincasa hispida]|uniref:early nodulin-like protein 1 n=1 Tax=Benincasa hispida TaxID=102211 RepID=UPI0018FF44A1|nr:early nodulin-like protein 1 [Benincasa hispida]